MLHRTNRLPILLTVLAIALTGPLEPGMAQTQRQAGATTPSTGETQIAALASREAPLPVGPSLPPVSPFARVVGPYSAVPPLQGMPPLLVAPVLLATIAHRAPEIRPLATLPTAALLDGRRDAVPFGVGAIAPSVTVTFPATATPVSVIEAPPVMTHVPAGTPSTLPPPLIFPPSGNVSLQ